MERALAWSYMNPVTSGAGRCSGDVGCGGRWRSVPGRTCHATSIITNDVGSKSNLDVESISGWKDVQMVGERCRSVVHTAHIRRVWLSASVVMVMLSHLEPDPTRVSDSLRWAHE